MVSRSPLSNQLKPKHIRKTIRKAIMCTTLIGSWISWYLLSNQRSAHYGFSYGFCYVFSWRNGTLDLMWPIDLNKFLTLIISTFGMLTVLFWPKAGVKSCLVRLVFFAYQSLKIHTCTSSESFIKVYILQMCHNY